MTEPGYEIRIAWSPEDRAFVAVVPELPGCQTHGATYETALANARQAMRLWMDMARELGHPIPLPKHTLVAG